MDNNSWDVDFTCSLAIFISYMSGQLDEKCKRVVNGTTLGTDAQQAELTLLERQSKLILRAYFAYQRGEPD